MVSLVNIYDCAPEVKTSLHSWNEEAVIFAMPQVAFCPPQSWAISSVLLNVDLMGVIGSFTKTHALDATCRAVVQVHREAGVYELSDACSDCYISKPEFRERARRKNMKISIRADFDDVWDVLLKLLSFKNASLNLRVSLGQIFEHWELMSEFRFNCVRIVLRDYARAPSALVHRTFFTLADVVERISRFHVEELVFDRVGNRMISLTNGIDFDALRRCVGLRTLTFLENPIIFRYGLSFHARGVTLPNIHEFVLDMSLDYNGMDLGRGVHPLRPYNLDFLYSFPNLRVLNICGVHKRHLLDPEDIDPLLSLKKLYSLSMRAELWNARIPPNLPLLKCVYLEHSNGMDAIVLADLEKTAAFPELLISKKYVDESSVFV